MSVFEDYLQEKRQNKERVKVYLKSRTGSQNRIKSIMLTGLINDFDDETVRLESKECIIERNEIVSIKPDDGKDEY